MQSVFTTSKELLIIDQEPLRDSATSELQTLFQKMRDAREAMERFESIDKPAFSRWLRYEFHDQLAEINNLQDKVNHAEEITQEVQMIRFALGCSYYDAYVNTMERRNLEGETPEGRFDGGENEASGQEFTDDEARENESSEQNASGDEQEKRRSSTRERKKDYEDTEPLGGLWAKMKEAAGDAFDSIKQTYRELARLLHPDLRDGGDTWTDELWHRTQAAYHEGDKRQLGDLLVLARVSLGEFGADTSVWDLRAAVLQLRKTIRDLRKRMTALKQDMEWEFTLLKDRTRLHRRISYDLDYQNEELTMRLEALEAQLARWSVPAARSRSRSRGRTRSSYDLEFDF
jgi:hypothetical protein